MDLHKELTKTVEKNSTRPTTNSLGEPVSNNDDNVKNFLNWFKGSKVVDDKDNPLVVYHGSFNSFDEFKNKYANKTWEMFSDSSEYANRFASGKGGMVYKTYLNIKNPLDLRSLPAMRGNVRNKLLDALEDAGVNVDKDTLPYERDLYAIVNLAGHRTNFKEKVIEAGYDGIIMPDNHEGTSDEKNTIFATTYIVFNSNQIKSVWNKGKFDPNSPKISESIEPNTKQDKIPTVEITQDGKEFKTGLPVTFDFVHNTQSATKLFGKPKKDSQFGRYFEPHGRYVTAVKNKETSKLNDKMISGTITFNNPLVIDNNNLNWKEDLSKAFGGLRGKKLSMALIQKGYDGVVTVDYLRHNNMPYVSEILDLTTFDENHGKKLSEDDLSAWHGTGNPKPYDKFDYNKVGGPGGEGAQAYGYGLYFAGKKEVADFYRKKLTQEQKKYVDGKEFDIDIPEHYLADMISQYGDETRDTLELFAIRGGSPSVKKIAKTALELFDKGERPEIEYAPIVFGKLYNVDIPDDHEYLYWDGSIEEQNDLVKKFFKNQIHGYKVQAAKSEKKWGDYSDPKQATSGKTGKDLYRDLSEKLGSDKAASDALREAGVPGIRYLDGGSRADGEGTCNYVIFDDSRIKILAHESADFDVKDYLEAPETEEQFDALMDSLQKKEQEAKAAGDKNLAFKYHRQFWHLAGEYKRSKKRKHFEQNPDFAAFLNRNGDMMEIIHKDPKNKGKYRVTAFYNGKPSGHVENLTADKAIDEVLYWEHPLSMQQAKEIMAKWNTTNENFSLDDDEDEEEFEFPNGFIDRDGKAIKISSMHDTWCQNLGYKGYTDYVVKTGNIRWSECTNSIVIGQPPTPEQIEVLKKLAKASPPVKMGEPLEVEVWNNKGFVDLISTRPNSDIWLSKVLSAAKKKKTKDNPYGKVLEKLFDSEESAKTFILERGILNATTKPANGRWQISVSLDPLSTDNIRVIPISFDDATALGTKLNKKVLKITKPHWLDAQWIRTEPSTASEDVKNSLKSSKRMLVIVLDNNNEIIHGKDLFNAAIELGMKKVPVQSITFEKVLKESINDIDHWSSYAKDKTFATERSAREWLKIHSKDENLANHFPLHKVLDRWKIGPKKLIKAKLFSENDISVTRSTFDDVAKSGLVSPGDIKKVDRPTWIPIEAITRSEEKSQKDKIYKIAHHISAKKVLKAIWIDKDNSIMDGHHRYEACKVLGFKKIPVQHVHLR